MIFRSGYDGMNERVSVLTGIENNDPSLTQQHQEEEANINTIVRRFGITGTMPTNLRTPTYEDFDEIYDYRTALEAVRNAERSFMSIPAEVRARFDNDPQAFMEFCNDPSNLEEMRTLGLANKSSEKEASSNPQEPAGKTPGATN